MEPRSGNGAPAPLGHAEPLVDQAGRQLGPRALQTRQRILDATVALLAQKPMRELRVIDIARSIGTSPATFYQYFKDVEDVVLHLASDASAKTPEIVERIRGDWTGSEGHERGRQLVNLVIDHWDRYAPILRVRNNASDEGDLGFREVRMKAMMPMVEAFTECIVDSQKRAASVGEAAVAGDRWQGGSLHPVAAAMAVTSVLERLSMYHADIEEFGMTREDVVETTATMLQSVMTSSR